METWSISVLCEYMHSWPWMLVVVRLAQGLHKIGGFQGSLEELEAGLQELRVSLGRCRNDWGKEAFKFNVIMDNLKRDERHQDSIEVLHRAKKFGG